MDKAYTMMYGLDKDGKIAGHGFIDYSSPEAILESLKDKIHKPIRNVSFLPLTPVYTKNQVYNIRLKDAENIITWDPYKVIININGLDLTVSTIDNYIANHPQDKIKIYNAILETVQKEINETVYNNPELSKDDQYRKTRETWFIAVNTIKHPAHDVLSKSPKGEDVFLTYKWMNDLRRYNNSDIVAYKQNKIMLKMWDATSSVANIEAATKPMDSALVNDKMDDISGKVKPTYNCYSPVHKFLIQEENAVGKKNVGINANGIKGLAGLEQYANIKHLKGEKFFKPNIHLKLSRADGTKIGDFHLNKIANIVTDENGFLNHLRNVYGYNYENLESNPLLLSLLYIYEYEHASHEDRLKMAEDSAKNHIFVSRVSGDSFTPVISTKTGEPILLESSLKLYEAFKLFTDTDFSAFYTKSLNKLNLIVTTFNYKEDLAKFLYFYTQFEDNAADILSVFISLSTD